MGEQLHVCCDFVDVLVDTVDLSQAYDSAKGW